MHSFNLVCIQKKKIKNRIDKHMNVEREELFSQPNPSESILIRHFPYYPKIAVSRDSFDNFSTLEHGMCSCVCVFAVKHYLFDFDGVAF